MDNKGKNNPNYKDGKHCVPQYCECGKERDYRAAQCKICSGHTKEVDEQELRIVVKNSSSFVEAGIKLGITRNTVKRRCEEWNIDISHMRAARGRVKDNSEYLCIGEKRINNTIKKIILRDNLLEYVCALCMLEPLWQGQELTLELDHISGDPCDNRIENLRFLCPNCHSQTPTNKGKNSRKGVL